MQQATTRENDTLLIIQTKCVLRLDLCGLLGVMGSVEVLGMDMILDSQNWMLFQATARTNDSKISQQSSLGHVRLKYTGSE